MSKPLITSEPLDIHTSAKIEIDSAGGIGQIIWLQTTRLLYGDDATFSLTEPRLPEVIKVSGVGVLASLPEGLTVVHTAYFRELKQKVRASESDDPPEESRWQAFSDEELQSLARAFDMAAGEGAFGGGPDDGLWKQVSNEKRRRGLEVKHDFWRSTPEEE